MNNVGIKMTGAHQCPDCRQKFDSAKAKELMAVFLAGDLSPAVRKHWVSTVHESHRTCWKFGEPRGQSNIWREKAPAEERKGGCCRGVPRESRGFVLEQRNRHIRQPLGTPLQRNNPVPFFPKELHWKFIHDPTRHQED